MCRFSCCGLSSPFLLHPKNSVSILLLWFIPNAFFWIPTVAYPKAALWWLGEPEALAAHGATLCVRHTFSGVFQAVVVDNPPSTVQLLSHPKPTCRTSTYFVLDFVRFSLLIWRVFFSCTVYLLRFGYPESTP